MLITKLSKIAAICFVLGFSSSYAFADHQEKQIKVIELHDSSVDIGDKVHKFQFEGSPTAEQIEEKIAELAPEVQEKVRNILKNLKIESVGDDLHFVKVVSDPEAPQSIKKVIELHTEFDHDIIIDNVDEGGTSFKFKFSGDEAGHFSVIKKLLKDVTLTTEQVVELQDLLAQK